MSRYYYIGLNLPGETSPDNVCLLFSSSAPKTAVVRCVAQKLAIRGTWIWIPRGGRVRELWTKDSTDDLGTISVRPHSEIISISKTQFDCLWTLYDHI